MSQEETLTGKELVEQMSEQIPQAAAAAGDSLVVTFTREQIDALLRLPGERHDHGAHRDGPCYGCADFDARKRLRYPAALPSIRKEVLREAREALTGLADRFHENEEQAREDRKAEREQHRGLDIESSARQSAFASARQNVLDALATLTGEVDEAESSEGDPDPHFGKLTGARCEGCEVEQRVGDEGWESRDMLDWCPNCFREDLLDAEHPDYQPVAEVASTDGSEGDRG